jgi:hypothetical protein
MHALTMPGLRQMELAVEGNEFKITDEEKEVTALLHQSGGKNKRSN